MINDFYNNDPNIRHIHTISSFNKENEILISTGDSKKYLDLWEFRNKKLIFRKRLMNKLGGHTAIAAVNGDCYLGSDFSSRPNYLELIDSAKYYFPKKAYYMYVLKFIIYQNRYLVSVNKFIEDFGGKKSVSIFDTLSKEFIYCDYIPSYDDRKVIG